MLKSNKLVIFMKCFNLILGGSFEIQFLEIFSLRFIRKFN